jgi:hypothetical protein
MLSVFGDAPAGRHRYTVHIVVRDDDGSDQQVTQDVTVDRGGPHVRISGDMGRVCHRLGAAMNSLNGGYLFLTIVSPGVDHDMRTAWGWQVLAGDLIPLGGDEAWHVTHVYPKAHGGLRLDDWTTYNDAWTPR